MTYRAWCALASFTKSPQTTWHTFTDTTTSKVSCCLFDYPTTVWASKRLPLAPILSVLTRTNIPSLKWPDTHGKCLRTHVACLFSITFKQFPPPMWWTLRLFAAHAYHTYSWNSIERTCDMCLHVTRPQVIMVAFAASKIPGKCV